jgi:hypothetical protein
LSSSPPSHHKRWPAALPFFVREVQTGGMTKQCVYDYLGSEYVVTVSAVSLCPLSIRV